LQSRIELAIRGGKTVVLADVEAAAELDAKQFVRHVERGHDAMRSAPITLPALRISFILAVEVGAACMSDFASASLQATR